MTGSHRRHAALVAAVAAAAPALGCGHSAHRVEALPASICSAVARGPDRPQLIVVSDLPMRGAFRPTTTAMAAAIRFTLARHGFRAGSYALGYQSCDDASAEAGNFTPGRCTANMKAYVADRDVAGVIGPFNSQCAQFQIPVADGASPGPLAMVSPANTRPGLTHASAGASAGEPGTYYPRGTRNYARLAPDDDAQAAALVSLARQLGARRLGVIDDGEDYGTALARSLRFVAGRDGEDLAVRGSWDPQGRGVDALARRVASRRPQAVIFSGLWQLHGVDAVHAVRAALPPRTPLLATDGFASLPPGLARAASGLWIGAAGVPPERMAPGGREIARRFGAGQLPGFGPPYAAQAAEVLMAAIARSDGTRASIARSLFAVRIRGSVLGPIAFDANGDVLPKPVSIYRVQGGRLVLDRVINPPARLVGCPQTRGTPAGC